MKRLQSFVIRMWQPLLLYSLTVALLLALFSYRLGSQPAGLSPAEVNALKAAHSWHTILLNPLYAPHKVLLLAVQKLGFHDLSALRSVSLFWGSLLVLMYFSLLKKWFTRRIALLGTLLFATSTWFLQDVRSVTPEILQASLVALLAVGGWLRFSRARVVPLLCAITLTALLCYIPGMIWFVLLAIIWQWRSLKAFLLETTVVSAVFGAFLFLVLIGPLVFAIVRTPLLGQSVLGLPANLPDWQPLVRRGLEVPLAIFVRSPLDPSRWLGHLPLLDVFASIMFVLGTYSFFYKRQLDRAKLLAGIAIVGTLLIAVSGNLTLTLLLPAVYIVVTAGLNLMLQQWLTVFPNNPLARLLGASLLVAAVTMASFYQAGRYFVAWQHAPTIKQTFIQKP